jgi:hypothetical protein
MSDYTPNNSPSSYRLPLASFTAFMLPGSAPAHNLGLEGARGKATGITIHVHFPMPLVGAYVAPNSECLSASAERVRLLPPVRLLAAARPAA